MYFYSHFQQTILKKNGIRKTKWKKGIIYNKYIDCFKNHKHGIYLNSTNFIIFFILYIYVYQTKIWLTIEFVHGSCW